MERDNSSPKPGSGPFGFPEDAFDPSTLPDFDTNFLPPEHLEAFIQALAAPEPPLASPSPDDRSRSPSAAGFYVTKRDSSAFSLEPDDPQAVAAHAEALSRGDVAPAPNSSQQSLFISARNDWAPVHERVSYSSLKNNDRASTGSSRATVIRARRKQQQQRRRMQPGSRTSDETREGYLYGLLKWPFLVGVLAWLLGLSISYMLTRTYIAMYERFVTWRGRRERLRKEMRSAATYGEWVAAARKLDTYLGNAQWKEENQFAYYDSKTVRRVWDQVQKCLAGAEAAEAAAAAANANGPESSCQEVRAVDDLKALAEACVKNNFVGVENPRLYSQTYYGTKNLVQNFVDDVERSVNFLISTKQLNLSEKRAVFKRLHANYGRTALCLSGGASFAYYHFGVVKALVDQDLLPDVITGTSGGALVAALVATRTNDELRQLLRPALAHRITACREGIATWFRRWWATGARFDSVDWAKQCSWWTRGSMTFREAYERTGRILNVSCVPADPHSPTILCNYITAPDCVIWSAVLASAAVPGILNPVVLMMKTPRGTLTPYSFGHKWKDGSLRTDIPIKALNLHFNVNFTIVSQVNPHVNLFFFSSRGSVGKPVTHRRGRGWRGGYLGSAVEQYLKLDLTKWLKVLRHLELLPRPLGQDWSQLWLQQFSGTITVWPKTAISDFWYILSDPTPNRLACMIHEGQQSCFPKIKFVSNRLRVERQVERGRLESMGPAARRPSIDTIIDEDDLRKLLRGAGREMGGSTTVTDDDEDSAMESVEADGVIDADAPRENTLDDSDLGVVKKEA